MQTHLVCFTSLKLPSAQSLVFLLADLHLKVGAKVSDAVAVALDLGSRTLLLGKTLPLTKYICSILK